MTPCLSDTIVVMTDTAMIAQATNSCFSSADTVYLTISAAIPYVNAMSDTVVCSGSPLTLTATGEGSQTWYLYGSAVPLASPDITASVDTSYVVVASNQCGSANDTVNVTAHLSETPSFTYYESLVGVPQTEVTFVNTTPNMGIYNFTWYFGDGYSEPNNSVLVTHLYTNGSSYNAILLATDTLYGCSAEDSLTFTIDHYGVDETSLAASIMCYPIPADLFLNIVAPENMISILIFDLSGREIRKIEVNASKVQIDLPGMAPGSYMLEIHTERGQIQKTFIKH